MILKKLFQPRRHTKEFHIFIDESISFQSQSNNTTEKFYTGFLVISTFQLKDLYNRYFQKIYHSHYKKEKKSVNVSDTMNRLALDIVKPFLTNAYIYRRPTYHKNDTTLDNTIMQQVLMLQSYIYPIKRIIEDLRQQNPVINLKLNIYLDQTNLNSQLESEYFSCKLLSQIIKNLGEENNVFFTYQTCDSKPELGIQMADMLVGAYRKQEKYAANDDNTTLIPFNVTSMIDTLAFQNQDTFLKLYGLVSITMKSPTKKDLTAFKKFLKNALDSDSYQYPKRNNFNTIRAKLTKAKNKTYQEEFNRKLVRILVSLNKSLTKIYGNKLPKAYIKNLSQKYNRNNCNRTIANMQRNINKLQKIQLSIFKIFKLKISLRRFNKQLDKLL
ncbi:DUF3800 domain-containing protein [Lactobacillus paragasseri]|uniref:DUF3800 domain-containing protein n=1 Tax=Lactobacillus paragasseri TaxID=2107999 RepID=UPI0012E18613|nr:DUF3800 domain-containing protein [Lactobacillus paragasseri]MDK8085607.1 DUF3800 domain-containing protein [Lactobacillus paragasseri]MDX5117551.1 DUF3800 domain-containing protein [Lactobacillus paragasseri]MDX5121431.1 DUF3800 domain-containing protein [Lactobacillus paragasseri]QGT97806.1 DUF3800 domain-containing protein [Lactobacillus paragasseri]UWI47020.1 DUF3800 domain-containing protein [Lactobacillus paragasseri]